MDIILEIICLSERIHFSKATKKMSKFLMVHSPQIVWMALFFTFIVKTMYKVLLLLEH